MPTPEIELDEIRLTLHERVVGYWMPEGRAGNHGSAGNTLEDLLGVPENNLRVPDYGQFELKTRDEATSSLLTLFHREPLPRGSVPKLLRVYGWPHGESGARYADDERSFRSTTRASSPSDRGFQLGLAGERIEFQYLPAHVAREKVDRSSAYATYGEWADDVESRIGELGDPLPVYWDKSTLIDQLVAKLDHTILATYRTRPTGGRGREIMFTRVELFSGFRADKVNALFEEHALFVDFDARTRHNHGTKVRIDIASLPLLFQDYIVLA